MYIADLHIHSKYSRATSRDLTPDHLDLWARRKGIELVGTGDFTHPAWREELKEKLIPAEEGFYILKDEYKINDDTANSGKTPRFVLTGEISSIYKKNGKTRKIHNVIILPGIEQAEILSRKLEAIGNIHSDGRPILGLDAHDLLEITLEACEDAIFIPAHIWTPHFSLFGAFSGFDTIEECFGDLTPHIHALETGLSSDPPMNWRLSALDKYTLVSNSDAHSPSKLGREANLINAKLDYPSLYKAIQQGEGFEGTIEFFPEEGKYHFDGHRNCKLCLTPSQTNELSGKCPICGKKITIGVQHRVEELADREEGYIPQNANHFESIAPLMEVIAASTGKSVNSVKVANQYDIMLKILGTEFDILRKIPLEDIGKTAGPCIQEGIRRLRNGQVERIPGYDGEYGIIKLLDQTEIDSLSGQMCLFGFETVPKKKNKPYDKQIINKTDIEVTQEIAGNIIQDKTYDKQDDYQTGILSGLNEQQYKAVTSHADTIAVIAGPGTGKTKTLISHISYLIKEKGIKPSNITAVTFTNKAAEELRERVEKEIGDKKAAKQINIGTFHSICLKLLEKFKPGIMLIDENGAKDIALDIINQYSLKISPKDFITKISDIKNGISQPGEQLDTDYYNEYNARLNEQSLMDFDDLILQVILLMQSDKASKIIKKGMFDYLLVDEFQDINIKQYDLIKLWNSFSKNLFVIGDPDQSIYGFRGSDAYCFDKIKADFENIDIIRLINNYRSTPEIINCALPVISKNPGETRILKAQREHGENVKLVTAWGDLSEGIFIAKEINRLMGGIDMLDAQSAFSKGNYDNERSFSDIAILYRTHRQAEIIEKCLKKEGIPYIVAGKDNFLDDDMVSGSIAFFRFLINAQDILSMSRALKLIINCPNDLIESFAEYCKNINRENLLEYLIDDTIYKDDIFNMEHIKIFIRLIKEFLPIIKKEKPYKILEQWIKINNITNTKAIQKFINTSVFYKNMEEFLQSLILGQEYDIRRGWGKSYLPGAVQLMTLHGAKGLEFPIVFLAGVNENIIPFQSKYHETDVKEERRLFYVGITRAKEQLIIITANKPSEFIQDIPNEYLENENIIKKSIPNAQQLSLFDS